LSLPPKRPIAGILPAEKTGNSCRAGLEKPGISVLLQPVTDVHIGDVFQPFSGRKSGQKQIGLAANLTGRDPHIAGVFQPPLARSY
jgi:hypothetical protein